MTQQEYQQKKRECLLDFCREHGYKIAPNIEGIFGYAFDRAYALGKQEKDADDDKTLKVNRQLFCRLCADADDYINEHLEEEDSDHAYYQGRSDALHELYAGEPKDAEDTVISGWVARDKDGNLVLHYKKPHRTSGNTKWYSAQSQKSLPRDSFPDLTWDDDPQEVEIILKRKKK